MPLIELLNTTKLRSLGFGHDRPHGGSSPQPYIQTKIPTKKELDSPSPDFLLRGATNADPFLSTGNDLERIGKWFFQEPTKGLLFIAKQNLLSRTATATDVSDLKTSGKLNGGLYLPTSTLFQIGVSAFGLHVNKQGLNPIPSDKNAGLLQGLLSINSQSQPLYGETAYINNYKFINEIEIIEPEKNPVQSRAAVVANALGLLSVGKKVKIPDPILNGQKGVIVPLSTINNFLLKLYGGRILNATPSPDIYQYSGGPDSILGLGNTNIKFATDAGGNAIRTSLYRDDGGYLPGGALTLTQDEIKSSETYLYHNEKFGIIGVNETVENAENLKAENNDGKNLDFRYKLRSKLSNTYEVNSTSHWWGNGKGLGDGGGNYALNNRIEKRTKSGDPGKIRSYDSVNLLNNYQPDTLNSLSPLKVNKDNLKTAQDIRNEYDVDLITFKIQVIDNNVSSEQNDTILYFRAYLDSISDQYTSDWDPNQYIGRSEKFYTFKSFDRSISLGWTVAAQSKLELLPMYERLNYLASVCAGDYSPSGYMRGNLIKLTIGGYIYEQVGILQSLSYEMREDTTWEISINGESLPQLAQVIRVTGFKFVPIHNFAPRIGKDFIQRYTPSTA